LKRLGSVDNSSLDTRRPASYSRDPETSRNARAYCTELDQIKSREQVATCRDPNCQQPLNLNIIVPVYNEGENINHLYKSLCDALDKKSLNSSDTYSISWKAYIIYDFAQDTTVPFIKALQMNDSRIVPTPQTLGKGALNALKHGFSIVHDDAVIVVMGDCSDDLTTIPRMIHEIESGATIVTSSRFIKGGRYFGGNYFKKCLSRTAGMILSLFGIGTNDPTNNFKMYSGKWIKSQKIESQGGFEIALELIVKAALTKKKIVEIPGIWKDRTIGESKFDVKKLLPHYIRWFLFFIRSKIFRN